ncbi:hypothetical protein ACGFZL_13810 [Streptomyces sp. NPDC048182]
MKAWRTDRYYGPSPGACVERGGYAITVDRNQWDAPVAITG